MPHQRAIALALAVIWGICATWIFWWLFVPVYGVFFEAYELALKSLIQNGWTGDQIAPYFRGVATALPALFFGFIFGFPLGIFATRPIIVTWAAFVAAFFITLGARIFAAQLGLESLVENLTDSLNWLTFLSALLFAFAGYRVRSAYVARRAAA